MPSPPSIKTVTSVKSPSSVRKSRLKFDFPIETLQAYSHFRQDEAAKLLGVASITLKRNCQRRKYRWPYRSIKAKLRREARITAQKMHTANAFVSRMKMTPSSSLPLPELLLSLHGNKKATLFNCSPTSASDLATSTPMVCSPKAQFPLAEETMKSELPPQLPPLILLLRNLNVQSAPATPPRLNKAATMRSMHHHPVDHKSTFYSASFHSTAPKFPMGRLSTLVNHCESQQRLPSTGFLQSRYTTY